MKLIAFIKAAFFSLAFILFVPVVSAAEDATRPSDKVLKIGVSAMKGIADANKSWGETLNNLSQNIKGYRFELVPIVGFLEMRNALKNKNIDFVLTNPLAYTELNKRSGITRILTLNKKQPNGVASTTFASVIFTRADRADIQTLSDAKGKSIIGVHEEAFGGWRMAVRELLHHNIDPYEDSSEILFTADNTYQSVVYAVLEGKADIGTVRTDIIEQLVAQGKIKLNAIKVLNSHQDKLSALHSTQHYPEWTFAVMPHVPSEMSHKVFQSLLNIQKEAPAAIAGKYVNWVEPLDYSEVYALSNELAQQHITFAAIWKKHQLTILLSLLFFITIIFYRVYLISINKKLSLSEQTLSQHSDHLDELVNKRTEELVRAKEKAGCLSPLI